MQAAARLGITTVDYRDSWGIDVVRYADDSRSTLVVDGQIFESLSYATSLILADKQATKAVVAQLPQELGIRTPKALVWPDCSEAEIASLLASGPVVCKPVDGSGGEGVAMNLRTVGDVSAHATTLARPALIEAQVAGSDLRLHAIGGQLVAACTRRPAFVTGDGQHTVAELVEQRRHEMSRQNPGNKLVVDDVTRELLTTQGLELTDVPPAGRDVQLKLTANMATGARAFDVTDRLHPSYTTWVSAIANCLNLQIFAVDIITHDVSAPPQEAGSSLIEINSHPEWVHHTFSEGRTHDIGAMLLRSLFPHQST